jgi:hypothetical protein
MDSTTSAPEAPNFWIRVLVKAGILFALLNLLWIFFDPMPVVGKLSLYNTFIPGRVRLPYGENPTVAYNLSLYNLPAMFASHELSGTLKSSAEYRVILIGDSSTWGYLLPPENTLAAYINAQQLRFSDGRTVHAYNLGYPVMSLTKDVLILSKAMEYQPDMIVWLVTLESFPRSKQLFPPLLQNNPSAVRQLIASHHLELNPRDPNLIEGDFFQKSLIGQRKAVGDWLRLQIYGIPWAATGIDQEIPVRYTPRQEDLLADLSFHDLQPPALPEGALALDVLSAGMRLTGDTPILLINEPVFISQGKNSDLRYNFYYPRWAYDAYRDMLVKIASEQGWQYTDLWNRIDSKEFTNSAVHMSPAGTQELARLIGAAIQEFQQP